MDNLSQELICHIASFLEREDDQSDVGLFFRKKLPSKLPPYATLSGKWQYAIECRTFQNLGLKSPELPYFMQIFTGHRRALLWRFSYDVVLPAYNDNRCAKYETQTDMDSNNRAFNDAFNSLFQFLKRWEAVDGEESNVRDGAASRGIRSLYLDLSDIYSPMDDCYRGSDKYEEDKELYESGKRHDLWENRYKHSFLQLLEHEGLPNLSCFSSFRIYIFGRRRLEPHSAVLIASKLRVWSVLVGVSMKMKRKTRRCVNEFVMVRLMFRAVSCLPLW